MILFWGHSLCHPSADEKMGVTEMQPNDAKLGVIEGVIVTSVMQKIRPDFEKEQSK